MESAHCSAKKKSLNFFGLYIIIDKLLDPIVFVVLVGRPSLHVGVGVGLRCLDLLLGDILVEPHVRVSESQIFFALTFRIFKELVTLRHQKGLPPPSWT